MKLKRIAVSLLAASLAVSLAACSGQTAKDAMGMEAVPQEESTMESAEMMDKEMPMEDAMKMEKSSGKMMDSSAGDKSGMEVFPAFEGMDLEGNPVKSTDLFGGNAATVINFWFTTCPPCVGELSELDTLNQELAEKGATLIGINSFTIGGDPAAIADAKEVLAKKGATYPNVYFDENSDAGAFVDKVYAFPTTYVVNRKGEFMGDPIVGALTDPKQKEMVDQLVDQAVAMDMGSGS